MDNRINDAIWNLQALRATLGDEFNAIPVNDAEKRSFVADAIIALGKAIAELEVVDVFRN